MQFQHISRGFFLEACWGNCSVTKLHLTLCDPLDCSTPGFPALHHLLEFAQTHVHWVGDALKPSRPLSFPSLALSLSQRQSFQMSWFFMSGSQNIGASASVLSVHVQGWFPLGLLWSPCCRVYHLKSVGTLLQVVGFESTGGAAPNLGILILIPKRQKEQAWGQQEPDHTGDGDRVLGGGREGDGGAVGESCLKNNQRPQQPFPHPEKNYCRDRVYLILWRKRTIWIPGGKITVLLKYFFLWRIRYISCNFVARLEWDC